MSSKYANITDLIDQPEVVKHFHWFVEFEVRIPDLPEEVKRGILKETLGSDYRPDTDDVDPWIEDGMMVQAGDDGLEVIEFVKRYVQDR